ncbi:MAG: C40 family peptidase [Actinomycetota bacterium]|nr:C40 family peptidase [Actinomycetota bacterium]
MRRASAALAAVVVTAVLASSLPADAHPVYPSKQKVNAAKAAVRGKAAQVKAIQTTLARAAAEVEAADNAAETAAEFYNFQMDQLATATRAAKAAQAAADAAARKAGLAQKQIGKLAAEAYMNGGMGNLAVIVGAGGPDQVLDRAAGLQVVSGIRQQTLADASQTKVVAGILEQKAAVALARQKAAARAAAKAKAAAEAQAAAAAAKKVAVAKQQTALIAQLAQLQRISVKLAKARQAGLAAKRAAEKRRQARLAALRAAQAHNGSGGGGGHLSPGGSSSGTAAGGRIAVSYAYAQLGKWYLWGAAGPSRFDCSGLTMRAWERAGVYLPHYSVAQYAMTEHVPVSDARPGDLVFYANNTSNPGSIHHVAIYIGGGRMIEAAHTGTQIRISSIWRSGLMAYAGRP